MVLKLQHKKSNLMIYEEKLLQKKNFPAFYIKNALICLCFFLQSDVLPYACSIGNAWYSFWNKTLFNCMQITGLLIRYYNSKVDKIKLCCFISWPANDFFVPLIFYYLFFFFNKTFVLIMIFMAYSQLIFCMRIIHSLFFVMPVKTTCEKTFMTLLLSYLIPKGHFMSNHQMVLWVTTQILLEIKS